MRSSTPPPTTASPFTTRMYSISIYLAEGLIALLALLFVYHNILPKKKGETRSPPPEAGGAWPIVGHVGLLTGSMPLHRTLANLSDKHGPLFTLQLGQMRVAVVSSMDLAKQCFTTNDRAFASRPLLERTKSVGFGCANFGHAPYGPYWGEIRKITTIKLLSSRRLELLKHIRVEEVGSLVRSLYSRCTHDIPVDMKWHFCYLSMNIIFRMVAGKRYFDLENEGNNGEAKEFKQVIGEFTHLLGVFTVSDAIPWLGWLDVGGHLKAMRRVQMKIDRIASAWLAEHRQEKESGSADAERDMIDVLIKEAEEGHLSGEHQTDTIIKATALALVSAATDTTSDTLEWTFSLLLNNRHTLQKAQDELDSQVGRERKVDEADVKNLPYLQAVVKESMRLYPVAPLLVPHQSIEPTQIGGYNIPAGSTLLVNVWKMHREPELWQNPEEFKPERFLTSHRETNFGGQSFNFLPFGSGRRMCPGWLLAAHVLHLTLARLMHSFEWSTPMDEPVDMTEAFGLTMPKATPLKVLLKPRLPPHLYE